MKKIFSYHFLITKVLPFAVFAVLMFAVAVVFHVQTKEEAGHKEESSIVETTDAAFVSDAIMTAEPTPREVYVPNISDLQAFPDFSTLQTVSGYFQVEILETILRISWEPVENADYYHMRILDANNQFLQEEIWKVDVTSWEFENFTGAKIVMLCYEDMGVDGTDDDVLLITYLYEVETMVTLTPTPTKKPGTSEPKPTPTPTPTPVMNKYQIIVDKADYAFGVFTYDENGEYTKLVATYPCALGVGRATPLGTHTIGNKGEWKTWGDSTYSPFYTQYTSGLYFHGPIYTSKGDTRNTLKPASYNEIGTAASKGCVRTTVRGARFVYFNCPAGTKVVIVDSSSLVSYPGKPDIDPNYPTWDPTDPDKPSAISNPTISLNCEPGQGILSGGGSYEDGTLITIHATPESGFVFVRWVDGGGTPYTQQSYTFYVTANMTFTAIFEAVPTPTPTATPTTTPSPTSTATPTPTASPSP